MYELGNEEVRLINDAREANALRSALAARDAEIARLNAEATENARAGVAMIFGLNNEIAQRDARIAELEAAMRVAISESRRVSQDYSPKYGGDAAVAILTEALAAAKGE